MTKISCVEAISKISDSLLLHGLLPTKKIKRYQLLKVILQIVFYFVVLNLIIKNIVNALRKSDMILLNRMVCAMLIPVSMLLAKVIAVFKNKHYFFIILEYLDSNIFNDHNEELNRNIQKIAYIARLILRYYTIVGAAYLSLSTFLPMVMDISLLLPMPYNIGKFNVYYKYIHLLVMVYLTFQSLYFDMLYLSLLGLCVAQVHILQMKLRDIFENSKEKATLYAVELNVITEEILKECVILHKLLDK